MLKLISDEVELFVPTSEQGRENPTTFGVVRMGKGQLDRLTVTFERGTRKKKGKTWESFQTAEFQKAIWRQSVRWVENLADKDGNVMPRVEDPDELAKLWEMLPAEPASEVIAYVQGMSTLDEDEEGNSDLAPDSEHSSRSTASDGPDGIATTVAATD
jgi:hypothetical protein